jgi:hypothetical protein
MTGTAAVVTAILAGGAVVGGALAVIDPLKARGVPPLLGELDDEQARSWSEGTLPTGSSIQAALTMLGYSGPDAIALFQSDTTEIRAWIGATVGGETRLPPTEAGFEQIPVALQEMMPPDGEGASPILPVTGQLNEATVGALGQAVRAVVFASGSTCMTAAGEAIEADASQCLSAWQQAFSFAYEANLATQETESTPPPPPPPPPPHRAGKAQATLRMSR